MIGSRSKTSPGYVRALQDHPVCCPKYSIHLLADQAAERLCARFPEKAAQNGIVIEVLENMPDHGPLFVSAGPTEAPQRSTHPCKGRTSHILHNELPHLRSRMPALGSVARVSEETVNQYMQAQATGS
jgi:putative transposase